jgi:hypothetical protein
VAVAALFVIRAILLAATGVGRSQLRFGPTTDVGASWLVWPSTTLWWGIPP